MACNKCGVLGNTEPGGRGCLCPSLALRPWESSNLKLCLVCKMLLIKPDTCIARFKQNDGPSVWSGCSM